MYAGSGKSWHQLETKTSNGLAMPSTARSKDHEIAEKPQRRRFTTKEKLRILRAVEACASGTVGSLLRREGIYSSHVTAWKQARERGDFDPVAQQKRMKRKEGDQASRRRVADLERENRQLKRRLERAELILEIQKKAQGLFRELESPETTDKTR
jgi:transposase